MRRLRESQRDRRGVRRRDIEHVRLRIERAAGPVRSAVRRAAGERGERAVGFAHHGRREDRAELEARRDRHGLLVQLRRKVDQVVHRRAVLGVRRRFGRHRLRRRIPLARHLAFLHGLFFHRPHGLSRESVERVEDSLLRRHGDGLDRLAVDLDVGEDRRGGNVEVPDRMMHDLVVPLLGAGAQVETHEALAVQVVARTMPAVVVAGGRLDRQVDEPQLFVDRHLRPHAGVPRVFGRAVQPACRIPARLSVEPCERSTDACRFGRRSRERSLYCS